MEKDKTKFEYFQNEKENEKALESLQKEFNNNSHNIFSQSIQSFNQGNSFIKDEENERGLNKMIDSFDKNNYNNLKKYQNLNDFSNKKIPGNIYSRKNNQINDEIENFFLFIKKQIIL